MFFFENVKLPIRVYLMDYNFYKIDILKSKEYTVCSILNEVRRMWDLIVRHNEHKIFAIKTVLATSVKE